MEGGERKREVLYAVPGRRRLTGSLEAFFLQVAVHCLPFVSSAIKYMHKTTSNSNPQIMYTYIYIKSNIFPTIGQDIIFKPVPKADYIIEGCSAISNKVYTIRHACIF